MKTPRFFLLTLTAFLLLSSCTRSNDDLVNSAQAQNISGAWRVTLFTDSGKDETVHFSGYTFQFDSSGVITAIQNNNTQTGTWSLNKSSNKFIIDLGTKADGNKPLGELTDDWKIHSISASEIKLADDNASNDELLTFTKN